MKIAFLSLNKIFLCQKYSIFLLLEEAYQEALDWLFVQMPNYQIDESKAYKPGLENITKLCDFFQNPQEN